MNNAVILGTFDGVHLGHRSVVESVKGNRITAVTFNMPPKSVIENKSNLLMLPEKRERALKELGVDEVLLLDFLKVRDMTAKDFLCSIKERFNPKVMACGFNYRFGKDALGDTEYLARFCKENGIELKCCDCVKMYNNVVSSSYIRSLIENGLVHKANSLMFEDFGFCARVVEGDKRGRTIGFPTINQEYPKNLVCAKFGVYKSNVLFNNNIYKGITNIGIRPTFKSDRIMAETFIFDYEGDLYGKDIEIKLINFIREEKKFSGLEELKESIKNDINKVI